MGLERFSALRGWPHKIHSDPGSQLVAADKELKSAWQDMDHLDIQTKCTSKGTDWQFSPADSPHYQGLTESLIKSVKRAVKAMYSQNRRLSWQEYSTVGHQIADLVNSRPLGTMGEVGDVIQVLTPNSLILGRNSSDNPGCWPENRGMQRISEVRACIDIFWKKWTEVMKPALILEKKWNSQVRDLKKNDIVLILESSPELGSKDYRLAKVIEAEPGKDGLVRSAKVMYKNYSSGEKGVVKNFKGTSTVINRCCQRLVLIVPVEELTTHKNDYGIEE